MAKTKRRREKIRRGGAEKERKERKEEKAKKGENNRGKEGSRRMGNLG